MLDGLDLMILGEWQRFERMVGRLVQQEYNQARLIGGPDEDGCDAILYLPERGLVGGWQSKFTRDLGSNTKRSVQRSMDSFAAMVNRSPLDPADDIKWVLCIPVEPSAQFSQWFDEASAKQPFRTEIWGRSQMFRTDELELCPQPPIRSGVNSAEALGDAKFRALANKRLGTTMFGEPWDAKAHPVVFLIGAVKPSPLHLPFFSKLILHNAVRRLQLIGHPVQLGATPIT